MTTNPQSSLRRLSLLLLIGFAAAAAPARGQDADDAPRSMFERNPAVQAALELPRQQPADYFQAVVWLIDLRRPELARPILDELIQLPLSDAQRADLVTQFGSRDMLRLARAAELAPAGAQFAEACMNAAATAAADPQRIAELVARLTDGPPEARRTARNDLAAAGQPAANATLEAMANEPDPHRRALLADAAAHMDPLIAGPLLAMLETDDPALRAVVAELLRHLRVPQAAPLIAARSASAERALLDALARYADGTLPFPPDEQNQIELWYWDDAAKRLTSARYPPNEARTVWLSRLARRLTELQPNNRTYLRQALVLQLEAAAHTGARGESPLSESLRSVDTHLLNDLLADALSADYTRAASAAAEAIGRRGDQIVLLSDAPDISPLAGALAHPNRRVRFAAIEAIMTIDPRSTYPGASRLPRALEWFGASTGEPQALVAMPTHAAASTVAGMLIAQGFDARATNRGVELVQLAQTLADVEVIFVDMGLISPDIRQVVYELRVLPTTGETPIALMAADGRLQAAQRLAADHDRVMAISRPHSHEVVARTVEQLSQQAGRDGVHAEERAAQAERAREWLAQLTQTGPSFYSVAPLPGAARSDEHASSLPIRQP